MAHNESLQSNVQELEAQALEMHKHKSSIERDLEAERLLKEQKTKVAFYVSILQSTVTFVIKSIHVHLHVLIWVYDVTYLK